jgi:hypothetical protein
MAITTSRSDNRLNGQPALSDSILQLADDSIFSGINFGAEGKSVTGECVFQTGEFRNFFVMLPKFLKPQAWSDTRNL